MFSLETIIGIVITLGILSVLILIHELGHFITARRLGIKVEEFGFGFPLTKALFQFRRGETLYSFYPVLIGGFVKLYGEDDAGGGRIEIKDQKLNLKEDLERAFFARPVWQRALVVLAGVIMNAVLAFLIYYIFLPISGFTVEIPRITSHKFLAVDQTEKLDALVISSVADGSPASLAGMKGCDEDYCSAITSINGVKPNTSEEFIAIIKQNLDKDTTLTVENQLGKREKQTVTVVPRSNPPEGEGALGISFSPFEVFVLKYNSPVQKVFSGVSHPVNLMSYNFAVLKHLIKQAVAEKDAEALGMGVSGPAGIVKLGVEINKIADIKEKVLSFMNLAGLLSISLAVFNVLPIPALDGGRLFFILVEGVTRKKVSPRIEAAIHTVGMVILLGLIVLVTFKDILQAL